MSTPSAVADPATRFRERIAAWGLTLERTQETETSLLGFGLRGHVPVVLKVLRRPDDEWRAGEIVTAFQGRGVVRVLDWVPGAVLMERLRPATRLVDVALRDDDEATAILARVIAGMKPEQAPSNIPTVAFYEAAFPSYVTSGDALLPASLVMDAHRVFSELARSQREVRLLHGDLHHDNVLFGEDRGWVAIDPKGILGELEYEVGGALRNPWGHPHLVSDPARIHRRIETFVQRLDLDAGRVTSWAFAQAVLAAIWLREDGSEAEPLHSWLVLASTLRAMLP